MFEKFFLCSFLFLAFFNVSGQDSLVIWLNYQGAPQELPVPPNAFALEFEVYGAQGGEGTGLGYEFNRGGFGAYLKGVVNFAETSLSELTVNVGGQNGYNGGGAGGFGANDGGLSSYAGNGGGMTSIQATLNGDPILLVTAAGGGGGGNHYYNGSFDASCSVDGDIIGGDGGILQGVGGSESACEENAQQYHGDGGAGASQTFGGQGGQGSDDSLCSEGGGFSGFVGASGSGGYGGEGHFNVAGGGGGGGYFGGGGGGSACWGTGRHGGGGGGGSSFWHNSIQLTGSASGMQAGDGFAKVVFYLQTDLAGCTNSFACNFNPIASEDDGSCDFCFCASGTSWNAMTEQCVPDGGSCGEGTVWDEDSQTCIIDETYCSWQPDSDGDQLIGVSDLLMFLSVFGDTDLDQDGIFDSNDDCVGEYDECGVCNGSGPSIPIIESIEILYDSLYAEQIDEWWVFEVGADTSYSLICGYGCTDEAAENYNSYADTDDGSCLYPWECGDLLEYQGYEYETVQIGEQCWFAENLRSNNYRNGDDLPSGLGESEWTNSTIGAVSVYGEGGSSCSSSSPAGNACDELFSLDEFGRLYNWYAVDDHRGLCPASWKVPTNSDWMTLELQLGISPLEIENGGWRGEQEAQLIKDSEGWYDGGSGTNSTGMTIKPAGIRNADGGFMTAGQWAMLWSSSTTQENIAINRFLSSTQERIALDVNDKRFGFSVRCIKD